MGFIPPESRGDVYCLKLNFEISKLAYFNLSQPKIVLKLVLEVDFKIFGVLPGFVVEISKILFQIV